MSDSRLAGTTEERVRLTLNTEQGESMGARIDRALELLVVMVLLVSGLGLCLTLAGHFLAIQVLLLSLLLTLCYGWRTRRVSVISTCEPDWRHLICLGLICLFFRLPAYNYVLGGQDQGLYVNTAHYIVRTGGIDVRDAPLEKLQGSPYIETYLSENRGPTIYLPGVYEHSPDGDKLQFQFYHLFPVWMALFIGIFGSASGLYALSFFALLSVLFFYKLALTASGSSRTALIAGGLLAVCPLHVWFSKFPVTEVPALAFSLIGFTYLAAYFNHNGTAGKTRYLWISALAFGALFVTRISGFMYMPFLIGIAMVGTATDENRVRQRAISIWAIAVTILYGISVWYGLRWSSLYATDIYTLSFVKIFGGHWRLGIFVITVAVLSMWLMVACYAHSLSKRMRMHRYLVEPGRWMVGLILLLGFVIGLLKI